MLDKGVSFECDDGDVHFLSTFIEDVTISVRPPKKKAGSKGADSYYEYDARGNRKANFEQIDFLSEETAEFDYNEEDKLYYAEVEENLTNIEYSSNGYRYVKQDNSDNPEFYIYDSSGRLHAKAYPAYFTTNSGTQIIMYPINQYIWGPDRVLAQIDVDDGKTYYYLYNGHGDVVQIIDTDGNIKNTYDYDVWGNFITKYETIDNPFTYFGQTYDETTGLYYLRARYYDPTTGRFTQQDPAEDGYNWYVYGNQNPIFWADGSGESATAAIAGAVYTAPEWVPWVAAGVTAAAATIYSFYKEHTKGARPSTEAKHQQGQARKQRDAGGEKGDARRTPRKDKKK